ncbi:MAG: hypothetical protein LH645_05190 [Actinomycetia bacterium]|nr:hypothetical protein [Actinomycetes bacterium]
MRSVRATAVALIASCAVVLTGCGGDDNAPAASDTTPTASTSASGSPTIVDSTPTGSTTSGDVADFPDVDGFTYSELPGAAFRGLNSALQGTPQIQGLEAKLVQKDGQDAGLVMRIGITPDALSSSGFEDNFLPGIAAGVAGSSAAPQYEDINGTKVVTIAVPNQTGSAYAWLKGSIATILVFKDTADAEAFAQAALA